MIARCRLFSHTCVVPSSSTLSSHCSFSLSLPLSLRFTRSKTARGKRRIFESRLSPSNAPLFFFFFFFQYLYTTYVEKGSMFRIPSTRSFHSIPRRTVLRDSFFIEVRGTVFEASVNRKRWLEEGRREIYGASNGYLSCETFLPATRRSSRENVFPSRDVIPFDKLDYGVQPIFPYHFSQF